MAVGEHRVYAVAQFPMWLCDLLIFDRPTLNLVNRYRFVQGRDVHGLLPVEGGLLAVSTGTDDVLYVRLEGDRVAYEGSLWRPDATLEYADNHHLNDICRHDGRVLVCGFGLRRPGERWTTAENGGVWGIDTDEMVATGLRQPHSVRSVGGELMYCASPDNSVNGAGGDPVAEGLPGYTRGLLGETGGGLLVGTSRGRLVSRSLKIENPDSGDGDPAGLGGVHMIGTDGVMAASVDLSRQADEVYDLADYLPHVSGE